MHSVAGNPTPWLRVWVVLLHPPTPLARHWYDQQALLPEPWREKKPQTMLIIVHAMFPRLLHARNSIGNRFHQMIQQGLVAVSIRVLTWLGEIDIMPIGSMLMHQQFINMEWKTISAVRSGVLDFFRDPSHPHMVLNMETLDVPITQNATRVFVTPVDSRTPKELRQLFSQKSFMDNFK